jgi:hypothetical protein
MGCNPALPARFLLEEGTDSTVLPLELSCAETAPPGRYPFSISLDVGGERIAVFEERLVRPLRWLYLGPLPDVPATWEHALFYQDNLFIEHSGVDGRAARWREIPATSVDEEGSIVTSRLAGADSRSCFLLYTMIESPSHRRTIWRLDGEGSAAIWVNGSMVLSSEDRHEGERSGSIILREGGNAVLIASSTEREPSRITFDLSDMSGLPVPGIGNDIASLIDGYHRLASRSAEAPSDRGMEMQWLEVTLGLDYENAREVCVIGSFNNWEAGSDPMQPTQDGRWIARLTLAPGRYPYKFLIDRTSKITDPASTRIEPDGFGGFNSILEVRANGR